eukprot:scpid51423/ scgid0875/ Transcription factor AP-2-epsilon; Activating enhancer-binding protein 2-epsilon
MSSGKQDDYRHSFAATSPNGSLVRMPPTSDVFSPPQHQHHPHPQQQHSHDTSPTSLPAHPIADNHEWWSPNGSSGNGYRPARGHSGDNRRFYPYPMPSRSHTASPPYSAGSQHNSQQLAQQHGATRGAYSEYQHGYPNTVQCSHSGSLPSMPELTPSSTATVRPTPDNVASSGPLPFDKEQILAQSSSRASFLTPPNSAPPCNNGQGGTADDRATPTSSQPSMLSHSSSTHLDAASHQHQHSQQQQHVTHPHHHQHHQHYHPSSSSAAPIPPGPSTTGGSAAATGGGHFSGLDGNSDNDSGHGDSPYTNVLRQSQSQLHDNPDSPDDSASGDGDLDNADNCSAEFTTGSGKKLKLSDEFARVPGRLSLLGAASKYVVTVGEIKRRLSPPECLNASLLGGVLRKAKAKNGGSDLRKALDDIGVALPPGRRKATSTSMLTSLVEEEAKSLANQFNEVCATMFPIAEMANTVAQQHEYHQRGGGMHGFRDHRQRDIHAALSLTNELREILDHYINLEDNQNKDMDRLPLTGLRQFSLITHSFGVSTISGVLTLFQNYLTTLLKCTGGIPVRDDHALHRGQMR